MLAALFVLLASCEDALRSKEERQQIDEIRQRVSTNPALLDAPDGEGEPPLHVAVWGGYRSLLEWLLARGADPAVRDTRGDNALHHAVYADRVPGFPTMRLLLRRGVAIDVAAGDGSTPLHLAAASMRVPAAKFLLEAGAAVDPRDRQGQTPLHRAAVPQPFASAEEIRGMIHLLVAHGASVGARMDHDGSTPLHLAALIDSPIAVEALLAEHADPDAPGPGGESPLHLAATFGRPAASEALLAGGADVNRRDDAGQTPLWRALHAPAAGGPKGVVDTTQVIEVLKRFGGSEGAAAPGGTRESAGAQP
jgi:cytohesin